MSATNAGLEACVECDLLERSGQCNANDVRAGCLVTFELEVVQCGSCLEKCNATTGDDALFDGCLCVTHCIFDAVLALLELDLGSSAGLDDCNAAGQLGQTFLQLLTVVIRVAVLDLGADLADTTGDCVGVAGTLDDGGLVLGDDDLACLAEELEACGLQGESDLFADDLATGEDGDVGELSLTTVTEAGEP